MFKYNYLSKIKHKIFNIKNNPSEYFYRLIYIVYMHLSYPAYKVLLKKFAKNSFIHPLSSLRNHKNILIGSNVIINRNVNIWGSSITIGNNVQINPNVCLYGKISIGNNVMIAPNCMIANGNHGIDNINQPMILQPCTTKGSTIIEDDVWIGANSVILDGVIIGTGAIVGGKCCY